MGWVGQAQHLFSRRILQSKIPPQTLPKKSGEARKAKGQKGRGMGGRNFCPFAKIHSAKGGEKGRCLGNRAAGAVKD